MFKIKVEQNIYFIIGTLLTMSHVVSQLKVPVYGIQRTEEVPLDSVSEVANFYIKVCINIPQNVKNRNQPAILSLIHILFGK